MKKFNGEILTLVLGIIFLVGFYSNALFSPNSYLFTSDGDGIKNYYTYQYHVNVDSSYNNFEGMNYPFGEVNSFTDNQPIIANGVKFLSNFSPYFGSHSIGIMNVILLLSLVITAFALYKILAFFKLPPIVASFFAIGIMVLAPQIYRIGGHFGLSYSFAIPSIIYFLLKRSETQAVKYAWYSFAMISFLFFIHPYLAMISVFVVLIFEGLKWLMAKNDAKLRFKAIFIAAILPIVLFQCVSILTDHHLNRPNYPTGFYDNMTKLTALLVPHDQYLVDHFKGVFNVGPQPWESWNYLGIFSLTMLFLIANFRVFLMVYERKWNFKGVLNSELNLLFVTGFMMLLYSLGIPYIIGFDFILDIVTPLRQLRALCRFSWVFYFTVNIFAAVKVFQWLKSTSLYRRTWLFNLVLIVISFLNTSEGWMYHIRMAEDITKSSNLFETPKDNPELSDLLNKIKGPEQYQALITLPFYYLGPEEYSIEPVGGELRTSMLLSYHLKLPLVNTCLSRTSLSESKKVIQSFALPYFDKAIRSDIQSKKPLLVVKRKMDLRFEESLLAQRASKIGETEGYEIYEISVDNWLVNNADTEIQQFLKKKNNLIKMGNFYVNDPEDLLFFNDFEDVKYSSQKPFSGKYTYKGRKDEFNNLFSTLNDAKWNPNQEYTTSYWYQATGLHSLLNTHVHEEIDRVTGQGEWYPWDVRNSVNMYKEWQFVTVNFLQRNTNSELNMFLKGNGKKLDSIFVDAFMIQKKNSIVYSVNEGILYKNNFPLGKVNIKDESKSNFPITVFHETFNNSADPKVKDGFLLLNPENIYSPGLNVLWDDCSWKNIGQKVIVSAKIKPVSKANNFSIVLSVEANGQTLHYFSEDFTNVASDKFLDLAKTFNLPPLKQGSLVKAYVFVKDRTVLKMDEIKVQIDSNFK